MPRLLKFVIAALVVVSLIYIFYASMHSAATHSARVCVTFNGNTSCRTAQGRTIDEAIRAAHDNACAQLTAGVTGTITCQQTPADSVKVVN